MTGCNVRGVPYSNEPTKNYLLTAAPLGFMYVSSGLLVEVSLCKTLNPKLLPMVRQHPAL